MARSPLHDDHHTFAIRRWLHARRLAVNQPVVVKGVAGLKTIGFGAVRLRIPLDQETGAVPDDHPLQVGRHGESSSRSSSQRCKETHSIS